MSEQVQFDFEQPLPRKVERFDGESFSAPEDGKRLTRQLDQVRELMLRGRWGTLAGMKRFLERKHYPERFPEQSISARIRDLRKARFGSYTIDRKRKSSGTWKYRMVL